MQYWMANVCKLEKALIVLDPNLVTSYVYVKVGDNTFTMTYYILATT